MQFYFNNDTHRDKIFLHDLKNSDFFYSHCKDIKNVSLKMSKHMRALFIRSTLGMSVKMTIVLYNPYFSQLTVKGQASVA